MYKDIIEFLIDYNWIAGYGILFLMFVLVIFFIKVIYNTIKCERNRVKYTDIMSVGDSVYFPVMSGSKNGEIISIDDDFIIVGVKVHKDRVYPENKL